MGKKNNKRKKEEIAEEWCFVCKDGGKLRVCDFRYISSQNINACHYFCEINFTIVVDFALYVVSA